MCVWNQEQQDYLVMRLRDLDEKFISKYEEYLEYGDDMNKKPKGEKKSQRSDLFEL